MENYEILKLVSHGSFGTVFQGLNKNNRRLVAMKNIKQDQDEGVSGAILREICFLKEFNHRNVVSLVETIICNQTATLIFEFCDQDLRQYLSGLETRINQNLVKSFMSQIFCGLDYIHRLGVIHRDIKPENILVNQDKIIKLADFGLSIKIGMPVKTYFTRVGTLWYRPPEILFGATIHFMSFDIWSAACVLAEVSNTGAVLFTGEDCENQLTKIFYVLGTPTEVTWPGHSLLPGYREFPKYPRNMNFDQVVPHLDPNGRDLLQRILVCNPNHRLSAEEALQHPFFSQ